MSRFAQWNAVSAIAVLALLGAPPPAAPQCSFPVLAPGVPQSSSASPTYVRFGPQVGTFVALGARSDAGSDHTLSVHSATASYPTCVSGLLASSGSSSGVVEVVVGDYRPGHNAAGGRYGQAVRNSGSGSVTFEWEGTARELFAGAPPESSEAAPEVLDVYQTFLEAGSSYTLNFAKTGADLKVLLFENAGGGALWAPRGAPAMLATITAPTLFTAPASSDYALIVVNDDGAPGSYELWIELCQAPDTLVSGVARPAAYPHRAIMQTEDPYWQAVGARGVPGANWNIAVYDTGRGSPEPICFGGLLGSSNEPSGVDFVIADLSSGPIKPFFVRDILSTGSGDAVVEWDAGPDEIEVNASLPLMRSTDASDVLETWDVPMTSGQQYEIQFAPGGAASLRWFLFANPNQGPGGAAWFGRSAAVHSGTGNALFVAAVSGWHGLVVVNENGQAGSYTLAVNSAGGVDAELDGAPRTALGAVVPNPLQGRTSIGFTLAGAARVRIEILDVAGRQVAHLDGGMTPAGPGTLPWDGRGAGGSRLAAGVYFARLFVDDAPVGAARMVLLR